MSGAIRDTEKLGQRQIDTLKRRNERELKRMEENHQNYKADLQKIHNTEIIDIQHQNHSLVDKEAQKKEKVLEEMRNHLHVTKDLTDKELKSLKDNSSKETSELQKKLSINRERISGENELYLEELNDRFNESSKKISFDGRQRVEELKTDMQGQYRDTQAFHDDKLAKQTEDFTTRYTTDAKNYKSLKDTQDNQFKKERLQTNTRQQTELAKMTHAHTGHIEKRDGEYRKGLKDQDLFFEKKYEAQLKRHTEDFKTLQEKNQKVVDGLKENLTKEITKVSSRHDDPFFKFESLKPKLTHFDDRIEVSVSIPDHSKQDLQLTTNGKEAVLSFNRRYADASKDVDGTINKVNKIESFTTRLQSNYFLDAKSVKSSYDDGVMTYVIKKA